MMGYFMLNFFKLLTKRILLKNRKCIVIDWFSDINYDVINKSENYKYPCYINNSKCNFEAVNEGCRISDSACYGDITLGRFATITGPGTVIKSLKEKINIGSFSSIGQNVCITDFNHAYERITSSFINYMIFNEEYTKDIVTKGPVILEEDVWIGSNTVILPGVNIGRGSVIGAGSVVTANIPRYSIAVGNPARVIAKRFDDNKIEFLEELKWWEWSIEELEINKHIFLLNLKNSSVISSLFDMKRHIS